MKEGIVSLVLRTGKANNRRIGKVRNIHPSVSVSAFFVREEVEDHA
jgi:hypothetical protein